MEELGLSTLEWVNPPRQTRSQKTLERILEAAEQLVLEQGFDGTSVAGVVKLAQSSVGAFYSRFPDKQALLLCLRDRFIEQAVATLQLALLPERWTGIRTRDMVYANVRFTLAMFRERSRLIAAFARHLGEDFLQVELSLVERSTESIQTILESRGERVGHRNGPAAVRFAVSCVFANLVARVQQIAAGVKTDYEDEEVSHQLAEMVVAYLKLEEAAPRCQ